MKKDKKTDMESNTTSIKDMSSLKKSKKGSLNWNSNEVNPMIDLDKKKIEQEAVKENVEVESETVKVVKIPNSKLLKAYFWKKENETFLAVGVIGIEKRKGDQTKQLQKEYQEMGTDQMIKVIAGMIEARETIKK